MKPNPDNQLFSTNYQKVLRFLVSHPSLVHMESEVRDATGVSRAGANNALRALVADRFVELEKKGHLSLYNVDLSNPMIRQLKVLINLCEIDKLVSSLEEKSIKIILFGSAADGTDSEDSDIDLFVLSDTPEHVHKTVDKHIGERRIHLVVRKPLDYMASKKKDQLFYDEVSRGIVVHEQQQ